MIIGVIFLITLANYRLRRGKIMSIVADFLEQLSIWRSDIDF